jgi:hypothetical protein
MIRSTVPRMSLTKTFPATYATAVAIMSATASQASPCITRHSLSCFSVVDGTWQGYARVIQGSRMYLEATNIRTDISTTDDPLT